MINFIPFLTLTRKELGRIFRIWSQTLIPPVINVAIYFIIFSHLFSQNAFNYQGFHYLQFLTPGLILMPVITGAYNNAAGSFFTLKFQNAIEELLVSPISEHSMIWGFVVGSVIRGLLIGFLVLIISMLFVRLPLQHPFEAFFIIVDTAIIFALCGLINAIYAKKFDDIGIVPNFILTPLTYLGGVFFAITSLPTQWQWLAKCNPIYYLISAFRYSVLGVTGAPLNAAILFAMTLTIFLYAYTFYLLKTGKNLRQ
jgi:ABC-2 type transport system permease protein